MLSLVLCLLALPALLLLIEVLAERRDRLRYPAPGRFAVENGLHVLEQGSEGPRVILESGLAATSISWVKTQSEAAEFARVIAYDRAGLGWSPGRKSPLALDDLLNDLAHLVNADSTPVILVGHSFGALLVSAFANQHPDQVAGLVLVDPVSVATYARPDEFHAARLQRAIRLSKRGAVLARFAVVRIALSLLARGSRKLPVMIGRLSAGKGTTIMQRLAGEVAKLPPSAYGPIRSHWSRPESFHLMADYLRLLPYAAAQVQKLAVPAQIPVVILSAASATASEVREREDLVCTHPASRHTQIPNTTHWVQLDRPDLVVAAIRELALRIE